MMMRQIGETAPEVTQLLRDVQRGDRAAFDRLVPLLYDQMKMVAERQLRHERAGHTLDATALVHEAYLKLAEQAGVDFKNRAHFLALAARVMRHVLVDYARRRKAAKRGGEWIRTTLSGTPSPRKTDPEELLALDAALDQLDARQREVVELRFFTGLSEKEIGDVLGVTSRTVRRDWVKARAWMYSELYPEG